MGNDIIFKWSNEKLVIVLDPIITFEQLMGSLKAKLLESENLLSGFKTVIQFKGREITEDEELELLRIIRTSIDLEIIFVASDDEEMQEMAKNPPKEKEVLNTEKTEDIERVVNLVKEGVTKFHLGTIRSGEILDYPGNIVILGDVNPGSIVKAEGNIIVMGTLNGAAHAGTKGNAEAFIVASNMNPFELRIDEVLYKNFSKTTLFRSKKVMEDRNNIAYLRNNILVIEKLTRKTLSNIVTN